MVSAGRPSVGMPRRVRAQATAAHLHRAPQSSHGRHVVVPEADHMLPVTGASALAEEIVRLLDAEPDGPDGPDGPLIPSAPDDEEGRAEGDA
ncbi:hypothetical protein [Streptomyces sp. NPDC101393]|uniref:hypothetical protein n=1 Tax=Streptomyces sp. NPDC101393 TaxID=3366141 RepID=UPI00381C6674